MTYSELNSIPKVVDRYLLSDINLRMEITSAFGETTSTGVTITSTMRISILRSPTDKLLDGGESKKPVAILLRQSLSVKIPTHFPFSETKIAPILCSYITCNVFPTVSSESISTHDSAPCPLPQPFPTEIWETKDFFSKPLFFSCRMSFTFSVSLRIVSSSPVGLQNFLRVPCSHLCRKITDFPTIRNLKNLPPNGRLSWARHKTWCSR